MSAHNFGRVYLLALMFVVVGGIGGCDTDELTSNLGAVHGAVLSRNGEPISSTLVTVGQSSYSALTNGDGRYVINLPVGDYSLTASKEGFQPITLPVHLVSSESYRQLDFTLAEGNQGQVELSLYTAKDGYEASQVIEMTLKVRNVSEEPITLAGKGFFAQDGMGNILWRVQYDLTDVTMAKGESKSFTGRWEWYSGTNRSPVVPGSEVSLYGFVHLAETDPEVLSPPHKVKLMTPKPQPVELDFKTIANGLKSSFRERRGLVIRSASDWAHFWESHQPASEAPFVDFTKDVIIAAMGGGTTAATARVVVTKLKRDVPYRSATGEFAPIGPVYCSIDQHFCTDVTTSAEDDVIAPFHIVVAPKFSENVEFIWNVVRTLQTCEL